VWSNVNNIYFEPPFESDFTIEVLNVLGQRLTHFDSKSNIDEVQQGLFSFPMKISEKGLILIVLNDKLSNNQVVSMLFLR